MTSPGAPSFSDPRERHGRESGAAGPEVKSSRRRSSGTGLPVLAQVSRTTATEHSREAMPLRASLEWDVLVVQVIRRVVGDYGVHRAVGDGVPQRLDVLPRPEGGFTL